MTHSHLSYCPSPQQGTGDCVFSGDRPYVPFLVNAKDRMFSNFHTAYIRGIRRPQSILVTLTLFQCQHRTFSAFHVSFDQRRGTLPC